MQLKKEQGIALVMALALMIVISAIVLLLGSRSVGELKHSRDDTAIVQALMLARGGTNLAGMVLTNTVQQQLRTTLQTHYQPGWVFGNTGSTATSPNANNVTSDLNTLAATLQTSVNTSLCGSGGTLTPTGSQGVVKLRVYVTASNVCGEAMPSNVTLPGGRFISGSQNGIQTYALPFVIVSEGTIGDYKRNIVLQGEYRFEVASAVNNVVVKRNFAFFALFTNRHVTSGGSDIWFTNRTLFDGPVHTNERFRFSNNPWFGGKVTSAGCKVASDTACDRTGKAAGAFFPPTEDGGVFKSTASMGASVSNPSFTSTIQIKDWWGRVIDTHTQTHAPNLTAGVDWNSDFVQLPRDNTEIVRAAKGKNEYNQDTLDKGLVLTPLGSANTIGSLELWAGDSNGNPPTGSSGNWTPAATYQYIKTCGENRGGQEDSADCLTYRYSSDKLLYKKNGGTWELVNDGKPFNGVIYSDDPISRFRGPGRTNANDPATARPALASFAQITVASQDDVRITADLTYEKPPCTGAPTRSSTGSVTTATCNNLTATNVLGIHSQDGKILMGTDITYGSTKHAPDNVTIHGVLMSAESTIESENESLGGDRGSVNVIGGLIQERYGAFGLFNSTTGRNTSGYGRSFTYDRRMEDGVFAPPYFPATNITRTTTVSSTQVGSIAILIFGQREQLY